MAVEYKTPGTKEFKKISYLKEAMMNGEPVVRKQALNLYNQIIKTEYDQVIDELQTLLDRKEKVIRQVEKRIMAEKRQAEDKGVPYEMKESDKEDKHLTQEISSIKFKLRYYTELKDIEIDSRLRKVKIKF